MLTSIPENLARSLSLKVADNGDGTYIDAEDIVLQCHALVTSNGMGGTITVREADDNADTGGQTVTTFTIAAGDCKMLRFERTKQFVRLSLSDKSGSGSVHGTICGQKRKV